jgi:hypothetical protein
MTRSARAAAVAVAVAAAVVLGSLGAASAPAAAHAAETYPPASTGTFAHTAHAGANSLTVSGLGADARATALISGSGPAPTLGVVRAAGPAAVHGLAANLAVGTTDAEGEVTFTLVFPQRVSGIYNVSVSTPDGHSVSGAITLPSATGESLVRTGTNLALWVVWLAGILVVIGVIAMLIAAARRRRG